MNKLISIRNDVRFTAESRLEIPTTLSDQLLHLVGVTTLDYPKGLVFFTKLERLGVAEAFIRLGGDWCNTYLPLGFSDETCNQLVVVDSESQEIATIDFHALLAMCGRELDSAKVIDVEETIKASRLRTGEEPKSWFPGVAVTVIAVVAAASGFLAGWWSAQGTLENVLYGARRHPEPFPKALAGALQEPFQEALAGATPESLAGTPTGVFAGDIPEPLQETLPVEPSRKDLEVCTLFQLIGHSH